MDIVAAVVAVFAGAAAFAASMAMVLRANPRRPIPFLRDPERVPGRAIALRAAGVLLITFGTIAMSSIIGYWAAAVVILALAPAFLAIPVHNRRVEATGDRG